MLKWAGTDTSTIVYDRSMLGGLLPYWTDLTARCLEDCVYYAPHYAMPLLETVSRREPVKVVTGWDGGRLIALLPVTLGRLPMPGLRPGGRAWRTDYTFNCIPLLDGADPQLAARSLIDGLLALGRTDWVLPEINAQGPVARALIGALEARRSAWAFQREFERASLPVGVDFDAHMQKQVSAKRRRELARLRRRLEEKGRVTVRSETAGTGLDEAVRAFLALEASGWKGRRRTALACAPETASFATSAFGPGASGGASRVDLLLLDGKPIAAGVVVFSGKTGFTVKGGYDEAYANYGAGLILEVEVIKSFLTDRWADRLDAATNGSHVIDGLWPDRVKVADLVFSLAAGPSARVKALVGAGRAADAARSKLKNLLGR